jgi:hypothetical protein
MQAVRDAELDKFRKLAAQQREELEGLRRVRAAQEAELGDLKKFKAGIADFFATTGRY